MKELEDAKRAAKEAAEAAKRALEESKLKEKEAAEALKECLVEQRQKEVLALKDHAETGRTGAEGRKEKKAADKAAQKGMLAEVAQIEKARVLREKERQQKMKE